MLTCSCSVSIQWEFQAVWTASRNISPPFHQLKSFIHPRINLSPFTKDFRVWETPIETFNNLSSFLWGSNYLQRYTSPSLSKCISFHHIVADWAAPRCSGPHIYSGRAQKWETLQEKFWSQQHPVFPGGHPSKYWLGSMLLNFSDRTRTGAFNMIWPLARVQENVNILFQQHTYTFWAL
jgi:hypothetical protein